MEIIRSHFAFSILKAQQGARTPHPGVFMRRGEAHFRSQIGANRLRWALMFNFQIVGANKARVWDDKQANGDESGDRANLQVRIRQL